jgi:predicted Zn-dependent peptidase
MLMRVLDDGMSTRLYHRLCDKQGLCYNVSANYDGYEDDGILDFAAGCAHERVALVTSEILAVVRDLAEHGPTDEELAKAKRRNEWEVRTLGDSVEDTAGFFAGGHLFERVESPAERLAKNRAVTREAVRDAAREFARPEHLNVVAVGLLEQPEYDRMVDIVKGWRGV